MVRTSVDPVDDRVGGALQLVVQAPLDQSAEWASHRAARNRRRRARVLPRESPGASS
jgi:hypothetical protein